MKIPKVLSHPVVGGYVMILLVTIIVVVFLGMFVSAKAAGWATIIGQVLAMLLAVVGVLFDIFITKRKTT